ncbi:MAG: hypothetical protein LBB98_09725 [Treponema sp.]|jgi:hypothetical protein|nr:hypothetical protein [Treponema sp.]
MKRTAALLCAYILALSGCVVFGPAVSGPAEREKISPEAVLPEVPETSAGIAPAKWTVRDLPQLTARIEFSGAEDAAECGISFYNSIKDPKTIAAVLFIADGELYPLEGLTTAFVKSETHELRTNAVLPRKSLRTVLKAETLYLIAVIDKIEYQFEPGRDFAAYKDTILKKLEAGGG